MRLLGVGIWRRAFAFSFMRKFGEADLGMGFFRVGHWPPNPDTNYRCVLCLFWKEGVLMVRFGY